MKYFKLLLLLLLLSSCEQENKRSHRMSDKNFILLEEIISPNKKFKILQYNFDIGATGNSRLFWAIVPININANHPLDDFILYDGYKAISWTENNLVILEKWEPYYFKEKVRDLKNDDIFSGVKVLIR